MEDYIKKVEDSIEVNGDFLIPILQDIQNEYRYLPEEALRVVAKKTDIALSEIYGVASFYSAFSFTPKGKNVLCTCIGTACHVRGSSKVVDAMVNELGIKPGETTEDGLFTIETANCLGCCAIGPITVVNDEFQGNITTSKALKIIKSLKNNK